MKRVAQPRRDLGIRTIFNILGPLTNPANAKAQVIGVFDKNLCKTLARVLSLLGTERGLVVHGSGIDEISNIDETLVVEVNNGLITEYTLTPEKLGFKRAQLKDIAGGTPEENAEAIIEILKGCEGPKRDIVVMNAAAAIVVGGEAKDLREGIEKAQQAIDSGLALRKLRDFVEAAGDPGKLEKILTR
jgi:anthranilate phosphoribosyltransferase